MTIFHRIYYYLSMFTISMAMLLMVYFFYLAYIDGNPPIIFEGDSNNITIVTGEYVAGGYIETISAGCLKTSAPSTVYYSIVGVQEYIMAPYTAVGGKNYNGKCFKDKVSSWKLPRVLPSGMYHIEFTTKFDVNNMATRYVYGRTKDFFIRGRNSDGDLLDK